MFPPISVTTVDTALYKQIITVIRLHTNFTSVVQAECTRRNIRYRNDGSVLTDDATPWMMEVRNEFRVPVLYNDYSPVTREVEESYIRELETENENGELILTQETVSITVQKPLFIGEYNMFHFLFVENAAPVSIRTILENAIKRQHDMTTTPNVFVLPMPPGTPIPASLDALFII